MGRNVFQPASAQLKWYSYKSTIRDTEFLSGIADLDIEEAAARFTIRPERNIVRRGERVALHITAASQWQVPVRLYNTSGQMVCSQSFLRDGDFEVPADITPGLYVLQAVNGNETASAKLVVK